jgi:hypothetical protein
LVLCLSLGLEMGCGGSSSPSSTSTTTITTETLAIAASSGTSQTAAGGTTFSAPLVATVTANGIRMSGELVTFTAPASGASGTFANGSTTETDITDSNGLATSSVFTANSTAGSYAVTAALSGASSPVSFSLTNVSTTSYAFFLSGQEIDTSGYYALAGSVAVDSNGNVLAGEQDYNDGSGGNGPSSPEPAGDTILGGTLTLSGPPGQGTLTLIINNRNLGVLNADGKTSTETLGVQFVNSDHALVMQFDGTATSSGSLDLQTLPSPPAGNYAFALSGIDSNGAPIGFGGVFSVSGTTISTGTVDVNDSLTTGAAVIGKSFSGTILAPDAFGRGTITGIPIVGDPISLNYYIIGPEVLRIIDVHKTDSALGSAFGQGAGTFTNASLGGSVFALAGNQLEPYGAAGEFATSGCATTDFCGVGDDNETINGFLSGLARSISGSYSIAANGYGSLTFKVNNNTLLGLGDIAALGVYMTDPALNLSDPNNPTGGGGALIVDLDDGTQTGSGIPLPGGTGVIVPQADPATTSFAGNYAAGWQNFNTNFCAAEFDMIAQGTMTPGGTLSLTGLVSDPSLSCVAFTDAVSSGNTFVGTPLPDPNWPGRYTTTARADEFVSVIDGAAGPSFQTVIYQASGGQLFWLGYDLADGAGGYVSLGPIEQQGDLSGIPSPAARTRGKR